MAFFILQFIQYAWVCFSYKSLTPGPISFWTWSCFTCWDQLFFPQIVNIFPDYATRTSLGTFSILLILRARWPSVSKPFKQRYPVERLKSSFRMFMVHTVILFSNMKSPSHECWHSDPWSVTVTNPNWSDFSPISWPWFSRSLFLALNFSFAELIQVDIKLDHQFYYLDT